MKKRFEHAGTAPRAGVDLRGFVRLAVGLGAGLAPLACGADALHEGATGDAEFRLRIRDAAVACAAAPGVDRVEAELETLGSGAGPLDVPVDCRRSTVELPAGLPPGPHRLEVRAFGHLQGTPGALLYSAARRFTTPLAGPLQVELAPEVAFLDLRWDFELNGRPSPCGGAVDTLRAQLVAEGHRPVVFELDCAAGAYALAEPLPVRTYTVDLRGLDARGTTIYRRQESRVLVEGLNVFDAALRPVQRLMELDWEFAVGADRYRACDAVGVEVLRLDARDAGYAPDETPVEVDCAQARPVPLPGWELPSPQDSQPVNGVRVRASGLHEFYAEGLAEPAGGNGPWFAVLEARGRALVDWAFTEACEPNRTQANLDVVIESLDGSTVPTGPTEVDARGPAFETTPLPYGRYRLRLEQNNGCRATGIREVNGPRVEWEPLSLHPVQ